MSVPSRPPRPPRPRPLPTLAAIDVGTNAVRLEIARILPDGNLEPLHQARDAIRPGEGLFKTGAMPEEVLQRLLSTLRRYVAVSRRYGAKVRAVATSAVREARNRDEIVRRTRKEAGLDLEVISGTEEARLICLGVLHGKPERARSLCLDIGGGSTELSAAIGEEPRDLFSVSLGAVRLAELFNATNAITPKQLKLMREYAREGVHDSLPRRIPGFPNVALGSSGTIRAVISFAAAEGTGHATARQIGRAVDDLVALGPAGRRRRFDPQRADIVVAGAVIMEAIAHHLSLAAVTAVYRGLRHGVLLDLYRRTVKTNGDHALADAALALGRRFRFDEAHGRQVARMALILFDELATLHKLPASTRRFLEMAALLHDLGHAVSYQKHHRHTQYLIANADIPGLADREREVVARIARYHRRSFPDPDHAGMDGLTVSEVRLVRKLSAILRVADALDRSHVQPIDRLRIEQRAKEITLRVAARGPVDLELWDVSRDAALFARMFGRRLRVEAAPS